MVLLVTCCTSGEKQETIVIAHIYYHCWQLTKQSYIHDKQMKVLSNEVWMKANASYSKGMLYPKNLQSIPGRAGNWYQP